jgi:transposase
LTEIAKILSVDIETVRRHIKEYEEEKELHCGNGESESFLTGVERTRLMEHLKEHTYLYVKDIQAYLEATFNVHYSISGLTKWLRAQGFRHKKPHGVPVKADAEAQAGFIQQYHAIKATAERQG